MNWLLLIQKLNELDKSVYEYILLYADPAWLRTICHFLVKSSHAAPVFILFFMIYFYKNRRAAFVLLICTLLLLGISEMTASILKDIFARHRPAYQMGIYISQGGYSFPSAHALNTMAFAVFWAYRFPSFSAFLYIFSITIGIARMMANYHFPGDIIFGWLTGYLVGHGFIFFYKLAGKNQLIKVLAND